MAWTEEEVAAKRKLYIIVTNDDGETVYKTWNADEGWKTVTLYLDETQEPMTDARKDVMGEVIGKSIWDHTQAAQLERDGVVLVRVTGQLVERMGDDWSPPVQCKLTKNDDGIYEMQTRYVEAS
jgi:hypothetical protein